MQIKKNSVDYFSLIPPDIHKAILMVSKPLTAIIVYPMKFTDT